MSGLDETLPTDTAPRGAVLVAIERKYGPLKRAVRCARPECNTSHKRGFVVTFRTSRSAQETGECAIGHFCGRKHFGISWADAERRFTAEANAAAIDHLARDFRAVADDVLPHLRTALPTLRRIQAVRQALQQHAEPLLRVGQDAWRQHGGQVVADTTNGPVVLGRLEGSRFWLQDHALRRAEECLEATTRTLEFLAAGPAPKLASDRIRDAGDIRYTRQLVEQEMQDGLAAIRPQALRQTMRLCARVTLPGVGEDGLRVRVAADGGALEALVYRHPHDWDGAWRPVARLG